MEPDQAQALVALVQAYFPALKLPRSTVAVWAKELLVLPFEVASEAVRLVGRNGTGGRPLQLSDIFATAESLMSHDRMPELNDRNELHDALDDAGIDPESQAIVDGFFESIGGRP